MNNGRLGTAFENEFCEKLAKHYYWVHKLARNADGQPADVIAVKNQKAFLIDCKVCSYDKFPLSRVEENQHFAMETWLSCGNGEGWFALKTNDDIYMIPHRTMVSLSYDKRSLNLTDIRAYGISWERWLANAN